MLSGMHTPLPLVERAFQLARSGACAGVKDIRLQLKGEGYTNGDIQNHLDGLSIRAALVALCKKS